MDMEDNGIVTELVENGATAEKDLDRLAEQIEYTSGKMNEQAKLIHSKANVVVERSSKGYKMTQNVIHSMGEIKECSRQTEESIEVLIKRSKEIEKVVSVITEIAAQTHLLSINAAVEASHAGDQGKGFAVVAKEIRKLAETSKRSAEQISELIQDIQTDTVHSEQAMATMKESVKVGSEAFDGATEIFMTINTSATNNLGLSQNIVDMSAKLLQDSKKIKKA